MDHHAKPRPPSAIAGSPDPPPGVAVSAEFQMLVAVVLIVIAVASVAIAVELDLIRRSLPRKSLHTRVFSSHNHHQGPPGVTGSVAGYAIYVYRQGRWIIEADLSSPGHEPSPPTMPGGYEGHVLKKESMPSPGR